MLANSIVFCHVRARLCTCRRNNWTSSLPMAERPRDACDFKGVCHFEVNLRLMDYVLRQYLRTVIWRMVILQLCRWKYSQKIASEPPFGVLRGNVRTPSIARWKARGRLPIRYNWTFFAITYGWEVISGNLSKSAFFERVGSFWVQILDGSGRRPPTTVEWLPFRVVSKYRQCIT